MQFVKMPFKQKNKNLHRNMKSQHFKYKRFTSSGCKHKKSSLKGVLNSFLYKVKFFYLIGTLLNLCTFYTLATTFDLFQRYFPVHFTPYSVQYTLYTIFCTVYTVQVYNVKISLKLFLLTSCLGDDSIQGCRRARNTTGYS